MQKDLKTGMVLGLVLAAVAAVWLSTQPSLSTKARMLRSNNAVSLHSHNADSQQKTAPLIRDPNEPRVTPQDTLRWNHEPRITGFHIVREGETLSDISRKYYGSANKWQKILEANTRTIKDANRIRPGTQLIITE